MGKNYTVGVLIGNAHTNHPRALIKGICDCAKGSNVHVIFFLGTQTTMFYRELVKDREDFDYQYNTVYDYAMLAQVDVLIIAYGSLCIFQENIVKEQFLERFRNIPYVLLEDMTEDERGIYIIADNYNGIKQCVEHLVRAHGYSKICYLSGPRDNRDAKERLQAYLDTMDKYGLLVTEDMIAYGNFSEYVDKQVEELLDKNPEIDAIVCSNDEMAISVYRVCEQRGLQIGKDIGVTGFDNAEMAKNMQPPLTTVLQDSYRMGEQAFEKACLLAELKHGTSGRLYTDFICRESCGCMRHRTLSVEKTVQMEEQNLRDTVLELRQFQHMAWMGPIIMRDLMQETADERQFYGRAVKTMNSVGAKNVLIYVLKKPVEYKKCSEWVCPSKLYLAASFQQGKITTYAPNERPIINKEHDLLDDGNCGQAHIYMNFLLFEGARQYGILAVEIKPEAIPYFYMVALQFGTSLRFFEVSQKERAAKKKLKEKNELLSFIAAYDSLTGIFNRRGIMESMVEFNRLHQGEQAYLLIGDLDHLKQINDIYGHLEGDCAIRTIAGILKEVLGEYGDIGRIGGDEFVAVFLTRFKVNKEIFIRKIYEKCEEYNQTSDKPYYVNVSLGAVEFTCGEETDFKEMIKHADDCLYQAKRERRKSIHKGSC
jgi:diguanylate cyclase (GGDEF)-like protein